MQLGRLTQKGLDEFQTYLEAFSGEDPGAPPRRLLTGSDTSETGRGYPRVLEQSFTSRLEVARYLDVLLTPVIGDSPFHDPGLWAWLALFHFEGLCPVGKSGRRSPGEVARWIPSGGAFRYYRHLLAGPLLVYLRYKREPETAMIVLCQPPHTPGDFVEQLASRIDFVACPAILGAATRLYYDADAKKPRRGAGSTERKPGTLRRFVDVVQQFDCTYDLYSMSPGDLLGILPSEFSSAPRSPRSKAS